MPASFIAAATALAVSSICGWRPISSGWKARVRPTPMASRGAAPAAGTSSRQNTSRCGDNPPSVPPDITTATRFSISDGGHFRRSASRSFSARVA